MINYTAIRSAILSGLNTHTNRLAILAEQSSKKPPLPYASVKFTQLMGNDVTVSNEFIEEVEDELEVKVVTNPEITLSVSCYGESDEDAIDLAMQAYSWFKVIGLETLSASNIVVVSVGAIDNRDSLIGDIVYERKQGFDVKLRVKGEVHYTLQRLAHIEMNT